MTEAWVLHAGADDGGAPSPGDLRCETYTFPDLADDEVLVEPVYGCWEGNMTHALRRQPVDICRQRGESKVVIGNAGVVRVLRAAAAGTLREGDLCLVVCGAAWDDRGYPTRILAYDAPGTVGLLAKRSKLHVRQLIRIPERSRHSPRQWAAFSLRYVTAWANWKVAYGCWRLLVSAEECPSPFVWAWGGGVSLAEAMLAKLAGCRATMISSDDDRLTLIRRLGLVPVDRRVFDGLSFDPERYAVDPVFRQAYQASEDRFLALVREQTAGAGVAVFVDFIGLPVFRASLKALARPGVITTAGWKEGMYLSSVRALECMRWHTHVHTHYGRYTDAVEAVRFAEGHDWIPPLDGDVYDWERIPQLAKDYAARNLITYYPLFQVNAL